MTMASRKDLRAEIARLEQAIAFADQLLSTRGALIVALTAKIVGTTKNPVRITKRLLNHGGVVKATPRKDGGLDLKLLEETEQ